MVSSANDSCSSFNCMSSLNEEILNSYTIHTIAFHTGRDLGRQWRLSVAIWRGRQSPGWAIRSYLSCPCTRMAAIHYWSRRWAHEAEKLMKHYSHTQHKPHTQTHTHTVSNILHTLRYVLSSMHTVSLHKDEHTLRYSHIQYSRHTLTHAHIQLHEVCWQPCQLMVAPAGSLLSCEWVTSPSPSSLLSLCHIACFVLSWEWE